MNQEIFPKFYRYLIWAIAFAVFALIALTGWIAINVAEIDREVYELRYNL
ncbi:MAG: hypothetical protein HY397_00670 [Candidatus Doudnabacteria bacterium]|nr:hypothetical protein [Candidatus Doudnabacteria bacterium]